MLTATVTAPSWMALPMALGYAIGATVVAAVLRWRFGLVSVAASGFTGMTGLPALVALGYGLVGAAGIAGHAVESPLAGYAYFVMTATLAYVAIRLFDCARIRALALRSESAI